MEVQESVGITQTASAVVQQHDGPEEIMSEITAAGKLQEQGLEALKDIVYGSTAGIIGKFIEYPFDTVKVRLQSQPDGVPLKYTGPLDCFKQSFKADGFAGLYRGISAPLVGAAVETSSLFFSYRLTQQALQATVLPKSEPLPLSALIGCGAASGAFTSLLLTPIELVKCKMQVPTIDPTTGIPRLPRASTIISSVYQHHGVLGFWHGQLGTFLRETGGGAAWFGSYEAGKAISRSWRNIPAGETLPVTDQMLAGAAAGMSYNFIFYPADTIKSRMQTEEVAPGARRTFAGTGAALWKQHGLKGMYRGCGITVARSAPSSAFIFTIYEALRKYLG